MKRLFADILAVEQLNNDVYRVQLVLSEAVSFYAGQYLEILLPNGQRSAFSIGSAPQAGAQLELHIRHLPDSELSAAVFALLKVGQQLEVELPKGDCYIRAEQLLPGQPLILVAASTGFSQIKSMAEHLFAAGVSNPVHIYWGARVASDLYYPQLPKMWAQEHANVTYHPVVSEPGDNCGWSGRVDLLPDAVCKDFPAFDAATRVYASGSPVMVYALLDRLEAQGVKESQVQSDVFAYAPRPNKS